MYEDVYKRNFMMVRTMPVDYEEPVRAEKRWEERNEWERDATKPKGCKIVCPTCFTCTQGDCTYG